MTSSLIAILLIGISLISKSASQFADVFLFLHMDHADNASITNFQIFAERMAANLTLGIYFNDPRMSLILARSDGRTRLAVSLSDSIHMSPNSFSNVSLAPFFSFPLASQHLNHDSDPIFERLKDSEFNNDRPDAPNFLIIFIQTNAPVDAKKSLAESTLKKRADVVIATDGTSHVYGDWKNANAESVSTMEEIHSRTIRSLRNALDQCEHEIEWPQACIPIAPKRCKCAYYTKVKVKGKSSKFCPSSVKNLPCDDTECPPIQLDLGPMPPWLIMLITFLILLVSPWICCPIICCALYCMIQRLFEWLVQTILDQGEKMVRGSMEDGESERGRTSETSV